MDGIKTRMNLPDAIDKQGGNCYDKRRVSIGADCQIEEGIPGRRLYPGLQPGMEASGECAPGGSVYGCQGKCGCKGSLQKISGCKVTGRSSGGGHRSHCKALRPGTQQSQGHQRLHEGSDGTVWGKYSRYL